MTAGQLRRHLDVDHGHPTRGWTWGDMVQAHGEFHRALEGTPTHTHDPDVDPAGPQDAPAPVRAGTETGPGHVGRLSTEAGQSEGSTADTQGPSGGVS